MKITQKQRIKIDMGKTMPQLPERNRRPQYDYSEGYYKGFGLFMTCALVLFIVSLVLMCVKFG